jgi:hypothetical protein
VIEPTVSRLFLAAGIFVAIDILGWRLVVRMFDRERLLTRYGG